MQKSRRRLRVVIVDDHPLVREGFREAIHAFCPEQLVVVGEAGNGREALELVAAGRVDAVLTDVRMPVMDGLELTRRVKAQWPHLPVVAISTLVDAQLRARLADAGAEAVLDKFAPLETLCAALAGTGPAGPDPAP